MIGLMEIKKRFKVYLISRNIGYISKKFGCAGTSIVRGNGAKIDCGFDCNGNKNEIIIGDNTILSNCYFFISGSNNRIVIGKNCYINNSTIWIEDSDNEISIGNHTTITAKNNITCIEGHKISIGNDCMFAEEVNIQCGDGHGLLNHEGQRINVTRDIQIGYHVWIGKRATVLKGTKISDSSVVATGAIVTKEFEQRNVVLAGVPAKIVKTDINWSRNRDGEN